MKQQLLPCSLEAFAELATWVSDAESFRRWVGSKLAFPFVVDRIPELLEATKENSFALRKERGELVAFGQVRTKEPGCAHLARIIVAPQARGHGIGRNLVRLLMEHAQYELGATSCTLRVYRDNPEALALYHRLGFSIVESRSDDGALLMKALLRVPRPA